MADKYQIAVQPIMANITDLELREAKVKLPAAVAAYIDEMNAAAGMTFDDYVSLCVGNYLTLCTYLAERFGNEIATDLVSEASNRIPYNPVISELEPKQD